MDPTSFDYFVLLNIDRWTTAVDILCTLFTLLSMCLIVMRLDIFNFVQDDIYKYVKHLHNTCIIVMIILWMMNLFLPDTKEKWCHIRNLDHTKIIERIKQVREDFEQIEQK